MKVKFEINITATEYAQLFSLILKIMSNADEEALALMKAFIELNSKK